MKWLDSLGTEGWLLVGELKIDENIEHHSITYSGLFVREIE